MRRSIGTQETVHPEPCSHYVDQCEHFQKIHADSQVMRFDLKCAISKSSTRRKPKHLVICSSPLLQNFILAC